MAITVWLWFTVLFANFAEALAEGRSKAQAAALKQCRRELAAKKLAEPENRGKYTTVQASALRKGDVVLVEAGDDDPGRRRGDLDGVASVNESAITGESAPVIRESGATARPSPAATRVLSDWIVVRVTVNPGETFVDRMIALVEGAKRQKTPNEIALTILLVALTLIFLLVGITLLPFSLFAVAAAGQGSR
ncbi:MAG: hypothetical protein MPW14_00590 [Candidatus Manganitrophus sp.]|nr:MAG: hypothetical protein MPW14_00590 [Candidatus Manganitrophus sp.]